MAFHEELLLSIVDNAIIGFLIIAVGYWLNRKLEQFKSDLDLRRSIAPDRAKAYCDLWKLTKKIGGTKTKREIDDVLRDSFSKDIYAWYWDEGNALYLSKKTTTVLLRCWPILKSGTDKEVKEYFSYLRTRLKIDCGVYTEQEATEPSMPSEEEKRVRIK